MIINHDKFYTEKEDCVDRYQSGTNISIINCAFHNSVCYECDGGAIYISIYQNLNSNLLSRIINCDFINCFCSKKGGSIFLFSKESNNIATLIQNCLFYNNTALRLGGAIENEYMFNLTIIESNFTKNKVKVGNTNGFYHYCGGAINCKADSTIENCSFSDNFICTDFFAENTGFESYGGAICCDTIKLKNCSFNNNSIYTNTNIKAKTKCQGAAVWLLCNCLLENCVFYNNSICLFLQSESRSENFGAAIYLCYSNEDLFEPDANLLNCVFRNNSICVVSNLSCTSYSYGAAICYDDDETIASMSNCVFDNNSICVFSFSNSGLYNSASAVNFDQLSNTNILNSVSMLSDTNSIYNNYGTALYFKYSESIILLNCVFKRNTFLSNVFSNVNSESYFAIYCFYSDLKFNNCNFTKYQPLNEYNRYSNNVGIYATHSTCLFERCVFNNNPYFYDPTKNQFIIKTEYSSLTCKECIFNDNYIYQGPDIHFDFSGSSQLHINDCTFMRATAYNNIKTTIIEISATSSQNNNKFTFTGNHIFLDDADEITIFGNQFSLVNCDISDNCISPYNTASFKKDGCYFYDETSGSPIEFQDAFGKCNMLPPDLFTATQFFTQSLVFSESDYFFKSIVSDFSKLSPFIKSNYFSESMKFSDSNDFTKSTLFSDSNDFTKSKLFSSSNYFTKTTLFSDSNYFTKSTSFSDSSFFSRSTLFSDSNYFTKSKQFSDSNYFSEIILSSAQHFSTKSKASSDQHFASKSRTSNAKPSKITKSLHFSSASSSASNLLIYINQTNFYFTSRNNQRIHKNHAFPKKLIIGISVGISLFIIIAILIVILLLRKKKSTTEEPPSFSEYSINIYNDSHDNFDLFD